MSEQVACPKCATLYSIDLTPQVQVFTCSECSGTFGVPASDGSTDGLDAPLAKPAEDTDATFQMPASEILDSRDVAEELDLNDATLVGMPEEASETEEALLMAETYVGTESTEDATMAIPASDIITNPIDREAGTVVKPGPDKADPEAGTATFQMEASSDNINDTDLGAATLQLDASDVSIDQIEATWQGAVGPGATIVTSLKGAAGATSSKGVNVRHRSLLDEAHVGEKEADFELLSLLGEGGMGMVFTGRQTAVDREIAVKMVKKEVLNRPDVKEKFVGEAAVTADLEHPNIVPIYDLGTGEDGTLFYAMKKVQGTPWDDVINEKDMEENLDILLRVCDAIAFAHSRGIIHRDLKPENVMLGGFNEVLVMDWGLAASIRPGGKADCLGPKSPVCGTPTYMAPEMALGDNGKINTCSDIYLLGAILYEIVSGLKPHTGKTVINCVYAAAKNDIQPTPFDFELVDIARKAMATEPADRYEDVQAFQKAITDFQDHFESTSICQKAHEHLEHGQQNDDYDAYNRAIFGYEEAVSMWEGNQEAKDGAILARTCYAQCALLKGDLDLTEQLLLPEEPEHQELAAEVKKARRIKEARQKRQKRLIASVIGLVIFIVVGLTIGFAWVNKARNEAVQAQKEEAKAKENAQQAEELAKSEEQKALAAKQEADNQRKLAEDAEKRAVEALQNAQQAAKAMREAQSQEEKALAQAQMAKVLAQEAEERTEVIQKRWEEMKLLRENRWWVFDTEKAKSLQQEAATRSNLPPQQLVKLAEGVSLPFVIIPKGTFGMGSPSNENGRSAEEVLHRVTLTRDFYMATTEITRQQWQAVTGQLPKDMRGKGPTLPVSMISYAEIQKQFLARLQGVVPEGFLVRLPTEAEWEWACRAGTSTPYFNGEDRQALTAAGWYALNAKGTPQAVGQKAANPWGLFDMYGNASEFCLDTYQRDFYRNLDKEADPACQVDSAKKVVRGGGFVNMPEHCRSAYRSYAHRENRYAHLGFRVVMIKK